MAFSLAALLGQLGGSQATPNPEDTIRVEGRQLPVAEPVLPPNMGNREYQDEAMAANDRVPERSGMFGVKGTLRDILGLVGDSFLMQQGRDPYYQPIRRDERLSDAMLGFTSGNEGALAAAERVTAMGHPEEGMAIAEQAQAQAIAEQEAQARGAAQRNLADDRNWGNYTDVRDYAARVLSAVQRPEDLPYALDVINRMAGRAGTTLEELGLSEQMTPEQIEMFSSGDMTVNQQTQIPFTERRVATGEYNAQTGRINANRPRSQAQPRSQTAIEYFQQLQTIPANQRSQEQQDWIDDYTGTNDRGRSSRPRAPAATAPQPAPTRSITVGGRTFTPRN